MRLGLFDPLDQQVYAHYGLDRLNTPESRALALRAAREGIVLLKNQARQLPLDLAKVALSGPFAEDEKVLLGNYQGVPEHVVTLAEGLKTLQPDLPVVHVGVGGVCEAQTCSDVHCTTIDEEGLRALANKEIVVLAVGINQDIESEGVDRC